MKVVAAYLLAVLGGNANPDAAAITKILSSVGVEADAERVKKLISELKGKNLEEIIKTGTTKLASMPSGGSSAPATAAPVVAKGAPKEEKKKEKEPEPEEDADMGFGLFD